MTLNLTLVNLFIVCIATNIVGPVNLKIMSQLDVNRAALLFGSLALLHVFIISARMITWFKILKNVPLSIAYPVISITFPVMLLISNQFFSEAITTEKVAGIMLIISGILVNQYKYG